MSGSTLKKTSRGAHFIEIPEDVILLAKWNAGDEIEIYLGSTVKEPKKDDVILRKK